MSRPSRLEILEYALEGVTTLRGVWAGCDSMSEEEESTLDGHLAWLEAEIARVTANFLILNTL